MVNKTIIVEQYKKRKTGPGIALSKNKEVDNYCKSSNETIDKIIKGKVQRQLDLDTISEEVFWDLFSNTVKENLISMDNLLLNNFLLDS